MEQKAGDFTRKLIFTPGYCWLHSDPKKNYGAAAMRMLFVLIGEKGAVQWMIGTEWYPEAAREHMERVEREEHLLPRETKLHPMGWDLGYHSPVPMYEGQKPRDCDFLGGTCYYDGSGLQADLLIEGFINGGEEWVWGRLEAVYHNRFEGQPWPDFTPPIKPHPENKRKA